MLIFSFQQLCLNQDQKKKKKSFGAEKPIMTFHLHKLLIKTFCHELSENHWSCAGIFFSVNQICWSSEGGSLSWSHCAAPLMQQRAAGSWEFATWPAGALARGGHHCYHCSLCRHANSQLSFCDFHGGKRSWSLTECLKTLIPPNNPTDLESWWRSKRLGVTSVTRAEESDQIGFF